MVFLYCIGFAWQGFGSRGACRGSFGERASEADLMLNKTGFIWLQDRPAAGQ